jgi:2-oxoglutarate dehydrogenase E2 component (dihydrolipoamide succinyltransferase)
MQRRQIVIAAGAAIAAFGVAFAVARAASGSDEAQAGAAPRVIEPRSAEIAAPTGTAGDLPSLAPEPAPAPHPSATAAPASPAPSPAPVTTTTPPPAPPPSGTTSPPTGGDDDDGGGPVIIGGSED